MLPDDLKECLAENNAGVPSLPAFDLGEKKEMVFGGLLSFNEGDMDSFYIDYYSNRRIKARRKGLSPALHRQQALLTA